MIYMYQFKVQGGWNLVGASNDLVKVKKKVFDP